MEHVKNYIYIQCGNHSRIIPESIPEVNKLNKLQQQLKVLKNI